jgi:2,3-bisphosphoglycerate-dependent phosphoglycerate mutase
VLDVAWLGVVRHGQSTGNLAAERAEASGGETVDVDLPDPLVPLSALGRAQAEGFGRRLAAQPPERRPDVVYTSTYRRAAETAGLALEQLPDPPPLRHDERLRDRELGVLDRLTGRGVAARLPGEQARRQWLGKFYYRPPGGESWADVALRLRSVFADIEVRHRDGRVLLVAHEALVHLTRYIIEDLSVEELLESGRRSLTNAGLSQWERTDGRLRPAGFDR